MTTVLRVVGYASIPIVAASTYLLLRSIGTEQRLRPRTLGATIAVSVAYLAAFAALLGAGSPAWSWGMLVAGGAVGVLVGRATPVRVAGGEAYGRRTFWVFGSWVVGFAYAELVALGALGGGAGRGAGAMFLVTGITVGLSSALWYRRSRMLAVASPAVAEPVLAPGACPHCGAPNRPQVRFCVGCGWRVALTHATTVEAT